MTADLTTEPLGRLVVRRPFLLEGLLAVVCTVAVGGYYLWINPFWNTYYFPSSSWVQLVILSPLSLVLLRRFPEVPSVVLMVAATIAMPTTLEPFPVLGCAALAMFFLGLERSPARAALTALVVLVIPTVQYELDVPSFRTEIYLRLGSPTAWSSMVIVLGVLALCTAAGGLVRSRRGVPAAVGNKLLRFLDDPAVRTWVDGVLAVCLVVAMIRELQVDPPGGDWAYTQQWVLLLVTAAPASLALRRRVPEIPLVVLAVTCLIVYPLAQTQWVLLSALVVALYSIGVQRAWWKSALYAGATLVALRVVSWLTHDGPLVRLVVDDLYSGIGDGRRTELLQRIWPVWLSASLALAWAIGLLAQLGLQNRQAARREAALVQKNQEQEQLQVLLEGRSQIARDLHDVVAHHVNLIVIQAETGPDLMERDRDDVLQGFQRIGDAGRKALGELDRMLSALRDANGVPDPALTPQPGLADLRALVDGLSDVTLELRGQSDEVPAGVQLTAYRLVQEALTNVVKHAQASRVAVAVEVAPDGLTTRVTDDGQGFDPATTPDGRHGLTGMRERVRVHEGTLDVQSRPGHGTRISAWLPLELGR
ncbi:sensor histidine kinase [Kribbella sp. DT2]|uniref:sensor histidine kinase n=1 Tax=Kribbella sp. DT2 TaxID=3393427 RepID=UPI003CED7E39